MTRGRVIYVNEFIFYTVRRRVSFIISKTARKQYYLFGVHQSIVVFITTTSGILQIM